MEANSKDNTDAGSESASYSGYSAAGLWHPRGPFWYFGRTLDDLGSSRMDTKESGAGFSSVLK